MNSCPQKGHAQDGRYKLERPKLNMYNNLNIQEFFLTGDGRIDTEIRRLTKYGFLKERKVLGNRKNSLETKKQLWTVT